jgi:hypothetical protein
MSDVRVERVRPLEEVVTEYLVGYRLRFRSVTFAEYALGHVCRLLGGEMIIDVDDRMVLGYPRTFWCWSFHSSVSMTVSAFWARILAD